MRRVPSNTPVEASLEDNVNGLDSKTDFPDDCDDEEESQFRRVISETSALASPRGDQEQSPQASMSSPTPSGPDSPISPISLAQVTDVFEEGSGGTLAARQADASVAEADVAAAQEPLVVADDQDMKSIVRVQALQRGRVTRRQHQKRRKDMGKRLIQELRKLGQSKSVPRLGGDELDELRFLAYIMPQGQRPRAETLRLLELLRVLPAFQELFAGLPPTTCAAALDRTWPHRFQSEVSVSLTAMQEVATDVANKSMESAIIVLQGELALTLVDDRADDEYVEATVIDTIGAGMQVTSAVTDAGRLPSWAQVRYRLELVSSTPVEVLEVPSTALYAAVLADCERRQKRSMGLEALASSEPWSRSKDCVQIVSDYLKCVDCFQAVPEAYMEEMCQQVVLSEVPPKGHICSAGEVSSGLHLILDGEAQVLPGAGDVGSGFATKAAEAATSHLRGIAIATLHADDACGEWELCLPGRAACYQTDVVATTACKVLFLGRALYAHYLLQLRRAEVLRANLLERLGGVVARAFDLKARWQVQALAELGDKRRDGVSDGVVAKFRRSVHRLSMALAFRSLKKPMEHPKAPLSTGVPVPAIDVLLQSAGEPSLPRLPVLEQFPHVTRKALCSHMRLWHAYGGEVVCQAGEIANALIIVVTGEVATFQAAPREAGSDASGDRFSPLVRRGARDVRRWAHVQEAPACTAEADPERGGEQGSFQLQTPSSCSVSKVEGGAIQRAEDVVDQRIAAMLLHEAARQHLGLTAKAVLQPQAYEQDGVICKDIVATPRKFLQSREAIQQVCGAEAAEPLEDAAEDLDAVNVASLGQWLANLGPGDPVCGLSFAAEASESSEEAASSRTCQHTAVILGSSADLLVLDHSVASLLLQRDARGLPPGAEAAKILSGCSDGTDLTPLQLAQLEGLVRRHLAFENLEFRELEELCRSMVLRRVAAGEMLCRQGEGATHFFQILTGSADVFMAPMTSWSDVDENDLELLTGVDRTGEFLMTAREGAAFGEKALLSPGVVRRTETVVAREQVQVLVVQREDYIRATSDWNSDKALRKRTLEALNTAGHQGEPLPTSMAELAAQAMRNVTSHFISMSPSQRIELVRHAQCLHVKAGERVFCGFDSPGSYPLCLVLSGCVGWYDRRFEVTSSRRQEREILREKKARAAAEKALREQLAKQKEAEGAEAKGSAALHKQLLQTRQALAEVQAVVQGNPLGAELSETLRLHALQKKVQTLTKEIEEHEKAEASKSSKPAVNNNLLLVEDSGVKSLAPTSLGPSAAFITAPEEVPTESSDEEEEETLQLRHCGAEFREGAFFGGWPEILDDSAWLPDASIQSQNPKDCESLGYLCSLKPGRFKAHAESWLLVLTKKACDAAAKEKAAQDASERAALLKRWLPASIDQRLIDRLLKFSHMEHRPKGSVLVKVGQQTSFVWMIVRGACQCSVSAMSGMPAPTASATAGDEVEPLPPPGGSAEAGPVCSRMASRLSGHAHPTLGILDEGQFAGLTSALWQQPEPLTVTVATASAELLAIPRSELLARLPVECIEALREQTRVRSEWHSQRCVNMASVPSAVAERLGRMRGEVQELQVARVMDSPFLRRFQTQGNQGLERLHAVCERFGNNPHSESDWVHSWQDVEFYHHMRLRDDGAKDGAATQELPEASRAANLRFARFHGISRKLREPSASNEYLIGAQKLAAPEAQVGQSFPDDGGAQVHEAVEESSPPPAESPERGVSPGSKGRRSPSIEKGSGRPISLRTRSRSPPSQPPLALDGGVKLSMHSKVFAETLGCSKILRQWDSQQEPFDLDVLRRSAAAAAPEPRRKRKEARHNSSPQRQRSASPEEVKHFSKPSARCNSPPPAPPPQPKHPQPMPPREGRRRGNPPTKQAAAAKPRQWFPPRICQINPPGINEGSQAIQDAATAYERIAKDCSLPMPRPPPSVMRRQESLMGPQRSTPNSRRVLVSPQIQLQVGFAEAAEEEPVSPPNASPRSFNLQTGRAPLRSSAPPAIIEEASHCQPLQVGAAEAEDVEATPPLSPRASMLQMGRAPLRSSAPAPSANVDSVADGHQQLQVQVADATAPAAPPAPPAPLLTRRRSSFPSRGRHPTQAAHPPTPRENTPPPGPGQLEQIMSSSASAASCADSFVELQR